MSKLLWIAGILLIAVGIALGLMVFVSTASVIGWGVNLQLAVSFLIGGVVSLGLGSVISELEGLRDALAQTGHGVVAAPAADIPEFGRRSAGVVAEHIVPAETAVVAMAATVETIEVSEPVRKTIEELEQARQNIEKAFDPKSEPADEAEAEASPEAGTVAEPEMVENDITDVEPTAQATGPAQEDANLLETAEAEAADGETVEEGQLYVVEERLIRARPARILSDGTVEAETEEGWMRFENLEHLDEYLDAMSPTV